MEAVADAGRMALSQVGIACCPKMLSTAILRGRGPSNAIGVETRFNARMANKYQRIGPARLASREYRFECLDFPGPKRHLSTA
jgi:hypothetical protein